MDTLLQDIRYAARTLRKNPGFTIAATLTLALGIGANTAVFSVLNGVVLRPLPLPAPERLVNVGWNWGPAVGPSITAFKFEYLREHGQVFEGLASWSHFTAEGPVGAPDSGLSGLNVSDDFFTVAGIQPVMGRGFTAEENVRGGAAVVVLGDALWRGLFAADPGVIGRSLELDGVPHTVVGVMPPSFRFPWAPQHDDLLRPLRLVPDIHDHGHNSIVLGRLRPGMTPTQAQADMDRVQQMLRAEHPEHGGPPEQGPVVMSFEEIFVGDLGRLLWVLLAAIGFVLLIACANVANLMLARAAERQRELSLRLALGAGRARLIRQLLTESLVIALLAGLLGIGLAAVGVPSLLELSPEPLPRQDEIGIDLRVLGFTLLVATLTGIGFGLAAALPSSRGALVESLKEGGRSAGGTRQRGRVRAALVASEAAVAVVLLCGAGLLIATFANLRAVDVGFRPDDVLVAGFARMPVELQEGAAMARFQEELVGGLGALPGVQAVATTTVVPFLGQFNIPVTFGGRPDASEGAIQMRGVSPAYFDALRVPVLRGRAFTASDRHGGPPVALINEATARHYFPNDDPIGQRLHVAAMNGEPAIPGLVEPEREIVGVVGDVRELGLRQTSAARMIYVPQTQMPDMFVTMPYVLIRSADPAGTGAALPAALRTLDARLPPPEVQRLTDVVGLSMGTERFVGTLLTVFAAIALVLTAVGIYGVIAYTVRQRTRELGVRVALGARPHDVQRLVTRQGMRPVLVGLAIGIAVALFATRVLDGLVFGVETYDPVTLISVALLLAGVGLVASFLPARRATRVDPNVALRAD